MHLFHAMVASETDILAKRWGMPQNEQGFGVELEPDRTLVNGLLPLFCEGLFLYNTQKMCGIPYPIITFDTYCSPLFFEMKHLVDSMSSDHTMERITKDNLFITTFDLWHVHIQVIGHQQHCLIVNQLQCVLMRQPCGVVHALQKIFRNWRINRIRK